VAADKVRGCRRFKRDIDPLDQLNVIMDIVGTPKDSDMSFIADEDTRHYLKSVPKKETKVD
jgi:hypothetical protein